MFKINRLIKFHKVNFRYLALISAYLLLPVLLRTLMDICFYKVIEIIIIFTLINIFRESTAKLCNYFVPIN